MAAGRARLSLCILCKMPCVPSKSEGPGGGCSLASPLPLPSALPPLGGGQAEGLKQTRSSVPEATGLQRPPWGPRVRPYVHPSIHRAWEHADLRLLWPPRRASRPAALTLAPAAQALTSTAALWGEKKKFFEFRHKRR